MSAIKTMNTALEKAKSVKDVFAVDFVAERSIKNYESATGRKDGSNWYQREVMAMMTIFAEKPDYAKADKMSIWGCLMTAARKGLSIADGHIDLVPYNSGQILKAEPNYKGLREQMRRMPEITFVNEAQVVLKGDAFVHDKLTNKITKHEGGPSKSITMDNIEAAYVRVEFGDKFKDIVMYKDELLVAKNKSKNKSEAGPWAQTPGEMCKKSVVKRANKVYFSPPDFEIADSEFSAIPEVEETVEATHTEVREEPEAVKAPEPEVVKTEPAQEAKVTKKGKGNMAALMDED